MPNPDALARLTPFSVKRAVEHPNRWFLSLLRSKCRPILLHAVEACPLLARQTLSFDFTLIFVFLFYFSCCMLACMFFCFYLNGE